MRALTIHEYGGAENLAIEEIETPVPDTHQVLVEVKNSSINPVDWKLRSGQLSIVLPRRWPRVLGVDCAGVVAAVGTSVKAFKTGDTVFGMNNPLQSQYGSYAQFALCEQDALAKMPDTLSFSDAASIPVAGLTAYKSLKTFIKLQPGQTVLINGASGGVGTFAVQLAKLLGANVTASCGADNMDFVRSLGADDVFDYKTTDVKTLPQKFDGIFDASAKLNFKVASKLLNSGGVYVTTVPDPYTVIAIATSFIRGKRAYIVNAGSGAHLRQELSELAALVTSNQLKPVIAKSISLDDVPDAHRESEKGHARGKIVINL